MDAIEGHEPFGEEANGPRVLRNEQTNRNRVKREGRRAATRADSHQRLYDFAFWHCRNAIQLVYRAFSEVPFDMVSAGPIAARARL